MLRTLFFGTPTFAVPTLEAMVEAGYRPLRVVTQPTRPAGRGRRPQEPPVALAAAEHGLGLSQPRRVRDAEFLAEAAELAPDVAVVVAFGQIFPKALLELPRHGAINLHASLLPRHRGAAPIQAAIAAGDTVTGVSAMQMTEGLDEGPVLARREVTIGPEETSAELAQRLAEVGARLMVETLERLETAARSGETLEAEPQDPRLVTYAPRLKKEDGAVDWRLGAREIWDRLRAFTPWPGLHAELRGRPLKIVAARPLDTTAAEAPPGALLGLDGELLAVACGGSTALGLERVQRPGKKALAARDFWNGERLEAGERFASGEPAPGEGEAAP